MLIIEDDPYYFLQFDKVQKEFITSSSVPSLKEVKLFKRAFHVFGSRGLPRFCPWT